MLFEQELYNKHGVFDIQEDTYMATLEAWCRSQPRYTEQHIRDLLSRESWYLPRIRKYRGNIPDIDSGWNDIRSACEGIKPKRVIEREISQTAVDAMLWCPQYRRILTMIKLDCYQIAALLCCVPWGEYSAQKQGTNPEVRFGRHISQLMKQKSSQHPVLEEMFKRFPKEYLTSEVKHPDV